MPREKGLSTAKNLLQLKKIAALDMAGVADVDIGKEVGLTRQSVARVKKSKEYAEVVENVTTEAIEPYVVRTRKELSKLLNDSVRAIGELVRDNKPEGLNLLYKATGMLQHEAETQQDQSITVVLPGGIETLLDAATKPVESDISDG